MSRRRQRREVAPAQEDVPNDLRDWVAIGMIVVASALLMWVPVFV
jgi:hypothetical protein